MALSIYMNFNGNTEEVINFYENVFDVTCLDLKRFKSLNETGDQVAKEMEEKILHATLNINGCMITFTEAHPAMPVTTGTMITLNYQTNDRDDIDKVYERLSIGGSVETEIGETFFSPRYGYIVDKFGIGWQLSLDKYFTTQIK